MNDRLTRQADSPGGGIGRRTGLKIRFAPTSRPIKTGLPQSSTTFSVVPTLRILVACEFSGVVRSAFRSRGFDAWSCDLLPAEDGSEYHIEDDVAAHLCDKWDLMVAFPPCTHLAVSGARWFAGKIQSQFKALEFVHRLMAAPIKSIAIENPVSIISSRIRPADQVIQPWMFGHGETKATCLWLKNLPRLKKTNIVDGREARIHRMPPSPDRGKERSRTYTGIADAMASQWGKFISEPLAL